jgi:hypothetical protein
VQKSSSEKISSNVRNVSMGDTEELLVAAETTFIMWKNIIKVFDQ